MRSHILAGLLLGFLFLGHNSARADSISYAQSGDPVGSLTVSAPTQPGTAGNSVDVVVNIPGLKPSGGDSSGTFKVTVKGISIADGAAGKATKIANAINTYLAQTTVATIDPSNSAKINLQAPPGTPMAGQAGAAYLTNDKTGEQLVVAQIDIPAPGFGVIGLIDYGGGLLSGVDATGAPATATASFGYLGVTDTVTLGTAAGETNDSLVSSMYSQLKFGLPPSLTQDLILDLPDDRILFDFPGGQSNYFVSNQSTDTGAGPSGGLAYTPVPEPCSLVLLGSGIASLAKLVRRSKVSARNGSI
jgi:hypothetical protein